MRLEPFQLKEMRLLAGMTLRSAAEATGVPKSTLWAIERGFVQLGSHDECKFALHYSSKIRIRFARAEEILASIEQEPA